MLIRKSLPVALLATCHQFNQEATPIFNIKLAELRNEPMRFIVDRASAFALILGDSPLFACFGESINHECAEPRDRSYSPVAVSDPEISSRIVPASYSPLLPPIIEEEDVQTLIDISAEMLPRIKSVPLTNGRPYDVEIRLTGDIKDWQPLMLEMFFAHATLLLNKADLAVPIMCKKPEDRPTVVPAQPEHRADNVWRSNLFQILLEEPIPAFRRPCLRAVDLPVDEGGP